jgi:hypothetical protein
MAAINQKGRGRSILRGKFELKREEKSREELPAKSTRTSFKLEFKPERERETKH